MVICKGIYEPVEMDPLGNPRRIVLPLIAFHGIPNEVSDQEFFIVAA